MTEWLSWHYAKNEVFIKDFFSKCDQTGFGHIYWRNLIGKLHFLCSVMNLKKWMNELINEWINGRINSYTLIFEKDQ